MALLLAPSGKNRFTGGFLTNDYLARTSAISVAEVTAPADVERVAVGWTSVPANDAVIVDSILLFDPAYEESLLGLCATRATVLLAHSLPSLLPGPAVRLRRAALAAEQRMLCHFSGAIAPSEFMARALVKRGVRSGSVAVVPLAPVCDGRRTDMHGSFTPDAHRTGGRLRFLTVANSSPAKALPYAAEVMSHLGDIVDAWDIVGAVDEADLAALRGGEIYSRVRVHGPVQPGDLTAFYRTCDVFLLLSRMESYGLVFAEAVSHAVPVVCLRVGGVPEVVGGGGLLMSAGLSAADAAAAIRSLARDGGFTTLREAAAAAGRALPTVQETSDRVAAILRELARTGAMA